MLQLFNTDFVVHVRKSEIKRKRKGKADHNVDESGQTSVMKKFKADHNVDESGVGGEGDGRSRSTVLNTPAQSRRR